MTDRNLLILTLMLMLIGGLGVGCGTAEEPAPADAPAADTPEPPAEPGLADDPAASGSGSIGRWRSGPGQRTIFDRAFRVPTTISFRADAGSWSGSVSIVDRSSNRSLCQRSISGGGSASCSSIQGTFRITVANDSSSRDTATGEIRFNN